MGASLTDDNGRGTLSCPASTCRSIVVKGNTALTPPKGAVDGPLVIRGTGTNGHGAKDGGGGGTA